MGSSIHYSSADDPPDPRIVPIREASDELLLAIARVEQSLKTVLTHIATIQREMGISQSSAHDVPLKPDSSWVGTP